MRRDDCSGPLHLWIEHRGAVRFIPTPYDIRHDEWNPIAGTVIIPGDSNGRARRLAEYARGMDCDLRLVEEIFCELEGSRERYADDGVADVLDKIVAAISLTLLCDAKSLTVGVRQKC